MNPDRRHFISQLAAAAALGSFGLARAASDEEAWPQHTVRVISPYGPGGSNDISARLICEQLGKRLHQQFLIENKPGAGTRLGNDFVAHAAADGYTLLYAAAPFSTVEAIYGKLSYDPAADFQPVTLAVIAPIFLVVNASSPARTLAEFIKLGKSKPEGLTFASPGSGSGPHLTGELLFKEAGVKGLTVQFRGDATAYAELLAGRVDATFTAIPTGLPFIQQGKLRVLAVASEERSPVYPAVPTFREQGFPNIIGYGWFGFMVPKGTPAAVVDTLSTEVNAVIKEPSMRDHLLALGCQPQGGGPAEFRKFIASETKKWTEVVKMANVRPE